jgi:hypothetical protein
MAPPPPTMRSSGGGFVAWFGVHPIIFNQVSCGHGVIEGNWQIRTMN